ncbi:MAG: hypothetical protein R2699_08900 [Acidimicrobiales bacterium]
MTAGSAGVTGAGSAGDVADACSSKMAIGASIAGAASSGRADWRSSTVTMVSPAASVSAASTTTRGSCSGTTGSSPVRTVVGGSSPVGSGSPSAPTARCSRVRRCSSTSAAMAPSTSAASASALRRRSMTTTDNSTRTSATPAAINAGVSHDGVDDDDVVSAPATELIGGAVDSTTALAANHDVVASTASAVTLAPSDRTNSRRSPRAGPAASEVTPRASSTALRSNKTRPGADGSAGSPSTIHVWLASLRSSGGVVSPSSSVMVPVVRSTRISAVRAASSAKSGAMTMTSVADVTGRPSSSVAVGVVDSRMIDWFTTVSRGPGGIVAVSSDGPPSAVATRPNGDDATLPSDDRPSTASSE